MQKISVLVPTPFSICTYVWEDALPVGTFVHVPFGRQTVTGVVWEHSDDDFPEHKLKRIAAVLPLPPMTSENRAFIEWVANYTLSPLGLVLKMALPTDDKHSKKPLVFDEPDLAPSSMTFSPDQQDAIRQLTKSNSFAVNVLDGVTGSGKTEVYFEAVAHTLKQGRQALIMLPEITLTAGFLNRFQKRFGVMPAVWHSGLTPKTRRDTWQAVLNGSAKVVIGARSALFLPYQNLGLIVVDEEHDGSYKQEDGVIYQARDMAVVRAQIGKHPVILATATPSIETYCNIQTDKYACVTLPERFNSAALPDMHLIDMRTKEKQPHFLSPALQTAIADTLSKKQQALLFLNRRGYAPVMLCKACGEKMKCPHCTILLTEHRGQKHLSCHQCGYSKPLPKTCPSCGEADCFISCGPGVERIAEECQTLFPTARLAIVTSDTVTTSAQFETIAAQLDNNEIDILIGTQMLAKGHHFKDLTLVGIVDADFGLMGGDLRAAERTFQLLQQVSGRAGREQLKGHTYLQTYSPENAVIKALLSQDRNAFLAAEMSARQLLKMPPFGRLASIILSAKNEMAAQKMASVLIRQAPFITGISFLGPVQAPIYRLRGKYRYRILIQADKKTNLQKIIRAWLDPIKIPASVQIKIDIDPYSFL